MNITQDGYNQMNILDKIAEREKEWEAEYQALKGNVKTPEDSERLYQLKIKLGYATPKNPNVECWGCGS